MQKLLIVLAIALALATPSFAQFLDDSALDASADVVAAGTRWDFCSQLPTTYAEATSTYTLANVTVTAGTAGADYTLQDDATNGGRELVLVAQDPITLTGNGTATYICVSDVANTKLLGCVDINGGTGRVITDYTTQSGSYDGTAKFQFRDIQ